ncbi:extracellular ligand-gated ion channel protein [Perilla frutescens var. frutescens]|nr:extracellular ligand-gated ion channel protein [Perilla frutescens var. frutescens]
MFRSLTYSSDCDPLHQRPYDAIVQLSLSSFAAVSFFCLSSFARKYGFQKFLFLDRLRHESEEIRHGYAHQFNRSMKLVWAFVLPCFLADSVYKIWWFTTVGTQIPYLYNIYLSKAVVCTLLICSWLYRTSICFIVCIIFRLTCYLQLLRLEDYAQVFARKSDVSSILTQHLRIRRNLRVISHRFRRFILSTLIVVTMGQFISLLVTTKPSSKVDIFTAGELALCSITLVTGLFICLRSAAKITHKAQAITSLAAKWHACSTTSTFDDENDETPRAQVASVQTVYPVTPGWDSDKEEGDEDDELDDTSSVPSYANTISYQKRQALAKYFEHNRAGISVYGFVLDRSRLHTIFAVHLSLTLWILNKTIGIS